MLSGKSMKGCPRAAFFCTPAGGAWLCLAFIGAVGAQTVSALPDPRITPGAIDPTVTPQNLHATVCVRGYTATVRPDKRVTNRLKREQIRQYRYSDKDPRNYEQDHLIPLSIGGNPSDPRNMWPQPREGAWGADEKNDLEFIAYRLVCSGQLNLQEAQRRIAANWIEAYQAWVPSHQHLLPKGRSERAD
jgi:hypothetical protein